MFLIVVCVAAAFWAGLHRCGTRVLMYMGAGQAGSCRVSLCILVSLLVLAVYAHVLAVNAGFLYFSAPVGWVRLRGSEVVGRGLCSSTPSLASAGARGRNVRIRRFWRVRRFTRLRAWVCCPRAQRVPLGACVGVHRLQVCVASSGRVLAPCFPAVPGGVAGSD